MHPARISQQSRYGPYGRTTPTHGSPAQPGPRPVQIFGRSVSNPNVSQSARELDSSSPLPSRRFGSQLQNMPSSFSWGLPSRGHDGGTDSGFGSEYSSEQCPPDDQLQSQHCSAVGGGPSDIEFEYGPSSDLTAVISSLGLDAAATEKAYSFASDHPDPPPNSVTISAATMFAPTGTLDKANEAPQERGNVQHIREAQAPYNVNYLQPVSSSSPSFVAWLRQRNPVSTPPVSSVDPTGIQGLPIHRNPLELPLGIHQPITQRNSAGSAFGGVTTVNFVGISPNAEIFAAAARAAAPRLPIWSMDPG
ncbi:hypothetical protein CPB85DRAFT_1436344 [Mucidula mucida]|nr:hypothetical protein CPB85DRAFT_1436344 [Mucidula mucida]